MVAWVPGFILLVLVSFSVWNLDICRAGESRTFVRKTTSQSLKETTVHSRLRDGGTPKRCGEHGWQRAEASPEGQEGRVINPDPNDWMIEPKTLARCMGNRHRN